MKKLLTKYSIKVPKNTSIIYCEEKKIITIIGEKTKKSIKLNLKLFIQNDIKVSLIPLSKISNKEKRKIKAIQGTTVATIKQIIIETSMQLYQKLKIIGVGYKILGINKNLLALKLGYSHDIYFKISNKLKVHCLKLTKLFLFGNSIQDLSQEASFLRSLKKPEPYKGKGIVYASEKILLKQGKKN